MSAAVTTEVPAPLLAIAEDLRTQDNRGTDQPLFAVRVVHRTYGVHSDYDVTGSILWDNATGEEFDPEVVDDEVGENVSLRRVHYRDTRVIDQVFLTEAGAQRYIDANRHNLADPDIYAIGSFRNAEMREVRDWLLSLPEPVPAEVPNA